MLKGCCHRPIGRFQIAGPCFAAFTFAACIVPAFAPAAFAAGTAKPTSSISQNAEVAKLYEQGERAADKGDFAAALAQFQAAQAIEANNPDVLNMLAYSQRKTGKIDEAIANYHRALELRPEFPEAREYLGEAYVQAALRELERLKSYGKKGQHEAEELAAAIREAAGKL